MKINLYKVKDFLYKYRRYITVLAVFVLLFFVVSGVDAVSVSDFNPVNWLKKAGDGLGGALISIVVLVLYYVFLTPIFWLIAATIWVLTEVASFQQFISVPAVIAGWTIMRDLVNMGFVLALIYISFLTIIGKRPNIGKDLVQLVIAVIAVNFSRMIVGLFIDLSQIIMLTFVNGFRNIAGGNIINKLNLKYYLGDVGVKFSISEASSAFVKVSLGIVMALFVLAILAMMTVYLIIRVVTLWILTIMSPMVALSYAPGADGVLKPFISEWNKQFRDALMGGPFMAFFLWFSLTVIGTTGTAGAITTPSGAMGESFAGGTAETSKPLFTLIIGTALLYAGYKQSKTMAGAAGDVGGKVMSMGKTAVLGGMKKIAQTADKGIGLAGQRFTGRDISVGGAIKYGREKYKGIQQWGEEKAQDWRAKGRKIRAVRTEDKATDRKDFKAAGLIIKEQEDVKSGLEEKIGALDKEASLTDEEKKVLSHGQNSIVSFTKRRDNEKEILNQLDKKGGLGGFDDSALEALLDSGKLSQNDYDILTTTPEMIKGEGKYYDIGGETLSKDEYADRRDSIGNSLRTNLEASQAEFKDLDGIDVKKLSADDISKLADKNIITSDEKSKITANMVYHDKRESLEKQVKEADEEIEEQKVIQGGIVTKALVEDRKTAGNRVAEAHLSEAQGKIDDFYNRQYNLVNSPDEIAAVIRGGGLKRDELNYLLKKSGSDLSEVLKQSHVPQNLSGVKALYGQTLFKRGSKEQEAANLLADGKGDQKTDALVTEALNEVLTQVEIETLQIISEKNKGDNASFYSATTKEPYGRDKIRTAKDQHNFALYSFRNGDLKIESMNKLFTREDSKGNNQITEMGIEYLFKNHKKLKKEPHHLSLGFLDAIGSDMKKIEETVAKAVEKNLITGELNRDRSISSRVNDIEYSDKRPNQNQAMAILEAVKAVTSQVGRNEKRNTLSKIFDKDYGGQD